MKNLLPKRPKEVSGGEVRRVSLVRALAHNPSLIALDEPTAYLDWEATETAIGLLQELREEGKTVVVPTHDPELIKVADVLYSLRYGRLVGG
ncbi:ATP-binding cassette domain-containing protein [Thermococcus sp.]|uniref:ATP-binding cassette domain-containing protein n=1 Tax=Thermococcus sp. TaxID=35749 RepID=UPI00260DF3E7|nr:ATP-binding cassette domain-containing protein [Thermococcus sp.]